MSYQKKYYFQFTSLDDKVNVVELWQDTANVLEAEEVKGGVMPFMVEMPDLSHKFQVVRGTGCEINLFSESDRKFFAGLYHTDMREFWVKHYIDDVLNWTGYLNSELVREPYSETENYNFQITGNDGFSLLDRLHFVDSTDPENPADYTGIKSKMWLLMTVINSIGLPYGDIYLSFSTTFTGQGTASDSSILHESYVDCANFYNEDGEAETMRKVLESILAPYGAFITLVGTDIYITDNNTLAAGSGIFKKFDRVSGDYFEAVMVTFTKDISDIGYMGTGSEIEMSGGKNKQVVSYSPYPFKNAIPNSLFAVEEFSGLGTWTLSDGYYKLPMATNTRWTDERGTGLVFEGSKENLYTEQSYYIKIVKGTYAELSKLKNPITLNIPANVVDVNFNVLKGVRLVVSGLCLYRSRLNPYNNTQDPGTLKNYSNLSLIIKCGSLYYVGSNDMLTFPQAVWQSEAGFYTLINSKSDASPVNNQWVNLGQSGNGLVIDFPDGISGEFNITVTNLIAWGDLWLRNLSFAFKNYSNEDVSDADIEYIGYLDKTVKEEAEKVELICGTDSTFIDRGKIMYKDGSDYKSIATWTRATQTFKVEELLLNSLSSNYRRGYITISNLRLKNGFNQLNLITDTDNITGKQFMVKFLRTNFRDNVCEATITEILPDSLTIIPY